VQLCNLTNDLAKKLNIVDKNNTNKNNTRNSNESLLPTSSTFKKGPRYPDWNSHRAIAFNSDKNVLVWINKEDHIEYKT
jgi:protein-arginine kinase